MVFAGSDPSEKDFFFLQWFQQKSQRDPQRESGAHLRAGGGISSTEMREVRMVKGWYLDLVPPKRDPEIKI